MERQINPSDLQAAYEAAVWLSFMLPKHVGNSQTSCLLKFLGGLLKEEEGNEAAAFNTQDKP